MHTFFVNTAADLFDADNVELFLFRNLRQRNQLICCNRRFEELSACARDIADRIAKDGDITEEFNVIVYIDVRERKDRLEAAWVFEQLALMAVNEEFAAMLHARGKKARNIQVVFGERFDRQNEFWENRHAFMPETRRLLWEQIGLPDFARIEGMIADVKAGEPATKGVALARLTAAFRALAGADPEPGSSMLRRDSELFRLISSALLETLATKIAGGHEICLYENMADAFETISDGRRRLHIQNPLQAVPLRFEDADNHKCNCSAYRLYLYVYRCAAFAEMPDSLPRIDLDAFAQQLLSRREALRKERAHVQKIEAEFSYLDITAIGGKEIGVAHDAVDIYPIDRDVPDFTVECNINASASAASLRAMRDAVLGDIRGKSNANEEALETFVMTVTEAFNDGKNEALGRKRGEYLRPDKTIKALTLSKRDAKKWKADTEGYITGQEDLRNTGGSFREQIEAIQARTDRLLAHIQSSPLIWAVLGAVLLLFNIPYVWLQKEELAGLYGGPMYGISIGAVALAFLIAYGYFIYECKRRVIRIMKELRDDFNASQRRMENGARAYKKLLTHYIPRSVILQGYYNDLVRFEEYKSRLAQLQLYHKNTLQAFISYLERLLRNLDIENRADSAALQQEAVYRYILNAQLIQEDASAIARLYYVVDRDSIRRVLPEGGGD